MILRGGDVMSGERGDDMRYEKGVNFMRREEEGDVMSRDEGVDVMRGGGGGVTRVGSR